VHTMVMSGLLWAKLNKQVMSVGSCASLGTTRAEYARVDFTPRQRGEALTLTVETTTPMEAHIFLGSIRPDAHQARLATHGLEFAFGIADNSQSVVRLGANGPNIASSNGPLLEPRNDSSDADVWSKFWLSADNDGNVRAGSGDFGSEALLKGRLLSANLLGRIDTADVYVGTYADDNAGWLLCHHDGDNVMD